MEEFFPFSPKSTVSAPVFTVNKASASCSAVKSLAPNYNYTHTPLKHSSSGSQDTLYSLSKSSDHHVDPIKAMIISHPSYPILLQAFLDCQKVGCSQEVSETLTAAAREVQARQRSAVGPTNVPADPELDQFMEVYQQMICKCKEELERPLQEAMEFVKRAESQLNSLTNGSIRLFSSDHMEDRSRICSSDDDTVITGRETELREIDPCAEVRELKSRLLKKYGGYLSGLRQELSKKKKKGKLPKEARDKLLKWWEIHYRWPYPSETEKVALAESTGLNQKQINNWFINQRKRHWKPSEDAQFAFVEGYQSHNATCLYMDGHYMNDGLYRFGP